MKRILLLLLLLLISNVSAVCNETQIDINSANLTELQEITQIGPSRAQAIIDSRPFSSVDDLARISGIGNGTRLNQIKEQGLACVSEETKTSNETTENEENVTEAQDNSTENQTSQTQTQTAQTSTEKQSKDSKDYKSITLETITLTKDIKSENGRKYLNKSNYAIYGFIAFCILLGILFLVKKIKKSYKSEFD